MPNKFSQATEETMPSDFIKKGAITLHNYNGHDIQQRNFDGFVCITDMARPFPKKRVVNYLKLQATKDLIDALNKKQGAQSCTLDLVKTIHGGSNPGTWVHHLIGIDFAQWVDVNFRLWALDELLKIVMGNPSKTETPLPGSRKKKIKAGDDSERDTMLKMSLAENGRLAAENESMRSDLTYFKVQNEGLTEAIRNLSAR